MHIEEIASRHLGRTSDGGVMTPYQSTDQVDPSLLVSIERSMSRSDLKLIYPMFGLDVWTCYEFSYIDARTGLPSSYILRFSYPASSPRIVESKSVKLFLNTFNFARFEQPYDACKAVIIAISEAVGVFADAKLYSTRTQISNFDWCIGEPDFTPVPEPILLTTKERPDWLSFESYAGIYADVNDMLRSNCRVTNQPDWADLYMAFDGFRPRGMNAYIASLRNENHFHEEVIELIFSRISEKTDNASFMVAGAYTRRGGIDITPIRTSDRMIAHSFVSQITDGSKLFKGSRQ